MGDNNGSHRVAAIDGLRGILAVVVVAWHVVDPLGLAWMLIPAKVAVAIFFILSGYALTRSWDGRVGVFIVRRFIRLWPVFALCLGCGYVIAHEQPVLSEFFWFPLMEADDRRGINPPAWSLFLEVWTMPLMPLIVWSRTSLLKRGLPLACVFVLASFAVPVLQTPAHFIAGAALARTDVHSRILESPVAQWLGRISYSLYLSHALVLSLAVQALGPWGGIWALPAVFFVGWLIWRTIERPSITLSRRSEQGVMWIVGRLRSSAVLAAPRP